MWVESSILIVLNCLSNRPPSRMMKLHKQKGRGEMEFAHQLKKYRESKGLSQEALAGQLFVSRQAVSKWEQGDATPDLNNLVKLTEILDVSLDTLVLGTAPETSKVDAQAYTFNPTTGLYVRRYGQMNGWDFLSRYWWALIGLMAVIGWTIAQIMH